MIRRLDSRDPEFPRQLAALRSRAGADGGEADAQAQVESQVDAILAAVRERGDAALLEYTERFDNLKANTVAELEVPKARRQAARKALAPADLNALERAADRIRKYHEHQKQESWTYRDETGALLGQQVTALERAGAYAPGGKASYPSSVLMNAIPAQVAGVEEIIMAAPAPGGELSDWVLAAADLAGVHRFFAIGGAQAIAALAFGTETVPKVDKIVGPGNAFVAAAKRKVFGAVGIDMVAGPSEILIICDGGTAPDWIALDLFAQAEHDAAAQAILLSPDAEFLERVAQSMQCLLPEMERADIIRASIKNCGALILTRDLEDAAAIANRIAPEHLELSVADPEALLPSVRHAGAIFLGRYAAEALGDYCAGPSHVLPTAATARFSSPLGVYDFQKRSSLIMPAKKTLQTLAPLTAALARAESLPAHARSAECRLEGMPD